MPVTITEPLVRTDQPERREAVLSDVEWRDDGDTLRFEGHAALFGSPSEDLGGFTEVIERGAFRKVLNQSPDVRLLINHDPNLVLARTKAGTMQLREDPTGLKVSASLAPTTYAKDLRILSQRGDVDQMSFGFQVETDEWTESDTGVKRVIKSFRDLFDVSVVTFPAYQATSATVRAMVRGVKIATPTGEILEDELRDLAARVHAGQVDVTPEERAAIDSAFERVDGVSPWLAERVLLADSDVLRGILPGKVVTVSIADEQPDVPFKRLARRRRLEARGVTLNPDPTTSV